MWAQLREWSEGRGLTADSTDAQSIDARRLRVYATGMLSVALTADDVASGLVRACGCRVSSTHATANL